MDNNKVDYIIKKSDDVEMENQSNWLIEHTRTLRVVLKRIKIYECSQCNCCYTTQREQRLHLIKHATPIVKTEFTHGKYGNYVKKFKCEECDKTFVAASTLKAHSVVHLPFPHVCHCGIGYNQRDDLIAHKQLVHPEIKEKNVWLPKTTYTGKKIKSEFCVKSEYTQQSDAIKTKLGVYKPKSEKKVKSKKKAASDKHPRNLTGVKLADVERKTITIDGLTRYLCLTCNGHYNSYRGLQMHTLTHTKEKPYKCDMCDKRFTQNGALKIHKLKHAGVTFDCSVCHKHFTQKTSMDLHMRTHTGEKPYECDFCGKNFADPSAFARHVRTHTGDKRYQCPECPMRFTDASGLIAHKRRHTGVRNYKCESCSKRFFFKSDLKKHTMSVHTRQYKYECHYCGKRFILKMYLRSHIERAGVHTGFKCDFCPRIFFIEKLRNKHVAFHERLEFEDCECDFCGETFDRKVSIAKHLKTEHNVLCH